MNYISLDLYETSSYRLNTVISGNLSLIQQSDLRIFVMILIFRCKEISTEVVLEVVYHGWMKEISRIKFKLIRYFSNSDDTRKSSPTSFFD